MFHLFDYFMDALKNGMVLFVDELDAKQYHPNKFYASNPQHSTYTTKPLL